MEKINLEDVPHLSIKEMAILPIEILLELEMEAEEELQSAIRQRNLVNGAIAIRNLRKEKANNGGKL